jgi:hypothetical protein
LDRGPIGDCGCCPFGNTLIPGVIMAVPITDPFFKKFLLVVMEMLI